MKRIPLLSTLALAATLAAHADTISTFELSSSYPGGGSVAGTAIVDTTTGNFMSVDFTSTGFSLNQLNTNFQEIIGQSQGGFSPDVSSVIASSPNNISFELFLPTATLVGYTGSPICTTSNPTACDLIATNVSDFVFSSAGQLSLISSVTTPPPSSVTPEPSSVALLGTGLLGVAGILKRRLA